MPPASGRPSRPAPAALSCRPQGKRGEARHEDRPADHGAGAGALADGAAHRWSTAQEVPLFPGVFAIFGHGNVTCLSEALEAVKDELPTWRGQNEQSMALAAIAFAKAKKRRQIMVAASSIGPGATNMVTAAGVAHTNRLPVLLLSGDYYVSRLPDPVLQQVEHFGDPTISVNDAFKPVTRYWDRIIRPEQLIQSLPQALGVMLDPADCGPAFIGLCQDVQAEAFDYPERFFEPTRPPHPAPAPRPARSSSRRRPSSCARPGSRCSSPAAACATAGRRRRWPPSPSATASRWSRPSPAARSWSTTTRMNAGPIGGLGSSSANELAAEADVVLAVGTRLQDFTTGSWSLFADDARFIGLNAARFDASKHQALPVVGDALAGAGGAGPGPAAAGRRPTRWLGAARGSSTPSGTRFIDQRSGPTNAELPTYAHVVGAINRLADPRDLALTAAGGMPGELCMNWRAKATSHLRLRVRLLLHGLRDRRRLGGQARRPVARRASSWSATAATCMMNTDIYSSVLTGLKLIVVVCDNGGFAVIDRLQRAKGIPSFNNQLADTRHVGRAGPGRLRQARRGHGGHRHHASPASASSRTPSAAPRPPTAPPSSTSPVHPTDWTEGNGAWWECGTPEVSPREAVQKARAAHIEGKKRQRLGV